MISKVSSSQGPIVDHVLLFYRVPIQRCPRGNYLPKYTQGKRTNNIPKRRQDPEGTQRGNDLALSADVRSMGQRNRSGCSLSTALSQGLACTSQANCGRHVQLQDKWPRPQLILSKHHGSRSFDPGVIEIDVHRKERLYNSGLSQSVRHCN